MNIVQILRIISVVGELLDKGTTTAERVREFLKQEGASDEQLARCDANLTDEMARRAADKGK